jgi:hypothetical protein
MSTKSFRLGLAGIALGAFLSGDLTADDNYGNHEKRIQRPEAVELDDLVHRERYVPMQTRTISLNNFLNPFHRYELRFTSVVHATTAHNVQRPYTQQRFLEMNDLDYKSNFRMDITDLDKFPRYHFEIEGDRGRRFAGEILRVDSGNIRSDDIKLGFIYPGDKKLLIIGSEKIVEKPRKIIRYVVPETVQELPGKEL